VSVFNYLSPWILPFFILSSLLVFYPFSAIVPNDKVTPASTHNTGMNHKLVLMCVIARDCRIAFPVPE